MGQNNQNQPAIAAPNVPAAAAPPPGMPPGGAPPAPGSGMTPQQLQLISQLLPSAAKMPMQAMALRARQQPPQMPPGTPGYGDAPALNPVAAQA